jgi:hypothetical protein
VKRLVLGTDGGTNVTLRDARRPDSEGWRYFVVELHSAGLDAVTGVATNEVEPLSAFLRSLEESWRGWEGERLWESTEPALTLRATHNGRHVRLIWELSADEGLWRASLEDWIEPGEQPRQLVADITEFMAPE